MPPTSSYHSATWIAARSTTGAPTSTAPIAKAGAAIAAAVRVIDHFRMDRRERGFACVSFKALLSSMLFLRDRLRAVGEYTSSQPIAGGACVASAEESEFDKGHRDERMLQILLSVRQR